MSYQLEHDPGHFPAGFKDPIAAEDIPFVTAYDDREPDPVPPASRLADEPETAEVDD